MQSRMLALLGVFASCTAGAPPGFSGGERWTFPLVGPLEDGLLITPVTVRGHGPYLFAIDPDANISAIDQQVARDAELIVGSGPKFIDESERGQTRFFADLHDLKIANLTIDRRDVMVFPNGIYDSEGRHISGVLGRDVIADSLVFGFDRDHGIAMLATVETFQPPPGVVAIKYEAVSSRSSAFVASTKAVGFERSAGDSLHFDNETGGRGPTPGTFQSSSAASPYSPGNRRTTQELDRLDRNEKEQVMARARPRAVGDITPVPRRLARARIGDASFAMHLDLGAVTSQLPDRAWTSARLAAEDARVRLVDEAASRREVTRAGTAPQVLLGSARTERVAFVPFVDRRWATEGVDGALGLDFFRPYAVYASWHAGTYYLKPRSDPAALTVARLGRWGAAMPDCPHAGCMTVDLIESSGGVALRVVRDAQAVNRPLEVFLGVTPAPGLTAAPLVVELPAGADQLLVAVPLDYRGATLTVLDASPFPRACEGDRGCLAQIRGPIHGDIELSPMPPTGRAASPPDAPGSQAAAPGSAARAPEKLRRVTGDSAILPSDDVVQAAAGAPFAAAVVRVCVSRDGMIDSTKIVKSSGVPAYDEQLQRVIKSTWTFEPIELAPAATSACISATFLPR